MGLTATDAVRGISPGILGKLFYYLLPIRRRIVLSNLDRVFGGQLAHREIVRLAQAGYAHFARMIGENLRFRRRGATRAVSRFRCENIEALRAALSFGKGALLLTGHFGNWEIAPVLWLETFPEYRGVSHVIRRPIRTSWIERMVTGRFRRAGLDVMPKANSLPSIIERLRHGDIVVFTMDQHSSRKEGVMVELFGHPARTFRGLAVVALRTGAPVLPLKFWRDPDGTQVVRFEGAMAPILRETFSESVRDNTQAYNLEIERAILEHPEQWIWMHRRWREARLDACSNVSSPSS
jgi:KDO2-lipid IV(A) lauroyltransferase